MPKPLPSSNTPLTAAVDRGPATYFHGRKKILNDFAELAERATHSNSGTIFLIQGAPGAGKTALLYECEKLAEAANWKVADIDPPSFWNVNELRQSLGLRKEINVEGGAARVSVPGIAEAEISAERSPQTVKGVLQKGKAPLLLILDEAQALGDEDVPPSEYKATAIGVLKAIHNGMLEKPVILLAAGLGTTLKSFESFRISRFAKNCFVELGALDKESERAIIHDWLKKEGGAKGDPSEWIDAIAQETHGWPHHILSYVAPASEYLKANVGIMTPDGLHVVLEAGREGRKAYYNERSYGFPEEERQGLAKAFADISSGESMTRRAILSSLAQDFEPDEAKDLFNRAWNKGLLDERSGRYVIPIPSMQDWFVSSYSREQISFPRFREYSRHPRDWNSDIDLGG